MSSQINQESLLKAIADAFGDVLLSSETSYGILSVEIPAAKNTEIISWLKEHAEFKMGFLTDLCAVHYPEQKGRELAVVYHLHSWINNFRLRVKCFLPADNPEISSMTEVFSTANWMERETFDFYGVQFTGHPDLRRILNMDEMDYHPLLKQYALEDETRDDKDDSFFGR